MTSARPAEAVAPNGSPIDSSNYTIDLYDGPILASSRVIGLGGSIAPLAEGVVGYPNNPAAVAMRVPWSTSWLDWELDGSITEPSTITNTDFDNNGDGAFATNAASFVTLGAGLQLGAWGLGLRVGVSEFELEASAPENQDMQAGLVKANLVAGRAFFDGQLMLGTGLGVQVVEFDVADDGEAGDTLASVTGIDVQVGAVWAPEALPLRVGVSGRFPVPNADSTAREGVSADANGNYVVEGYYVPAKIVTPVEFQAAIALQLFRRLNVRWHNPHERPPAELAAGAEARARAKGEAEGLEHGHKLLLSAALQLTLPTQDGVGVESFMRQVVERSGQRATFSPRFGVESEPVPGWLLLRGGTYLEPTRFEASSARLHGTAGLDFHIPVPWSVFGLFREDTTFRVGGAIDSAARYFGWSLSVGVWH